MLIVALVLLVILTLLGVSVMNTTSLEDRMAANSQETNRAFHTAETGLSVAMATNDAFDITETHNPDPVNLPGTHLTYEYDVNFKGWSPPPPDSLYSATSFQAAHFEFVSTGDAGGSASATISGGAYQIAPSGN